ncbi:MAG: GNAT family N-acetyltransferase [Spirochaetaceae bacterium]|nr:MAG: GNAT family N-acetyltransferase [Spirochaetaceae bacterium]
MQESFGHHESFDKEIRSESAYAPDRIFFLCFQEEAVGTAAAMYRPEWGQSLGYLHFLAVLPAYSGKGLGAQISLRALLKMREEGRVGAVLETADFRVAAIKTYLNLGFEPLLVHSDQRTRWRRIFSSLGTPELEMRFRDRLQGPICIMTRKR